MYVETPRETQTRTYTCKHEGTDLRPRSLVGGSGSVGLLERGLVLFGKAEVVLVRGAVTCLKKGGGG